MKAVGDDGGAFAGFGGYGTGKVSIVWANDWTR
jgi:hypothetical protein